MFTIVEKMGGEKEIKKLGKEKALFAKSTFLVDKIVKFGILALDGVLWYNTGKLSFLTI